MPHDYRQDQRANLIANENGPQTIDTIFDRTAPGDIGGTTPGAGTFTDLTASGLVTANSGLILPSADPHRAGAWWDNAGTLTKSVG